MNNQKISVKKNYLYNTTFHILVLLLPFVTTPYVSRVLGAENIGEYSYASAMVIYFTFMATMGTGIYGQKKIACSRDNKNEMSRVFWNVFSFRCITSLISLFLYTIYLVFFEGPNIINLIFALNIIDVILNISWFYQGIEEFKIIVLRNLVVRIFCLIGIFIFVKTENDTWIYVLVVVLGQVLGNIAMWRTMPSYVGLPRGIKPFEDFREILLIFLPSIAIEISAILDKSMIGWITESGYALGCYEQAGKIAKLATTIVTSVGVVVLPRVANLFQNGNMDNAKKYVYQAFRVVWLLSTPIMFGLMSISSVFIPLFLGTDFGDAIGLLCIFSMLVMATGVSHVMGMSYLIPTKQQKIYTVAITTAAGVNVVLNLIMIPRIGSFGAAIASVVAEVVGAVIQIFYCVLKKQLVLKEIFLSGWKYWVSGGVMYCGIKWLKMFFASGIVSYCILVGVGVVLYAALLLILKDKFFVSNLKTLGNYFYRRICGKQKND